MTDAQVKLILFASNCSTLMRLLEPVLADEGFQIKRLAQSRDIIQAARTQPFPEVILLTETLDDDSGLHLLHRLKEDTFTGRIPIFFIAIDSDCVSQALRYGADQIIEIPFEPKPFIEALHDLSKKKTSNTILLTDDSKTVHQVVGKALEGAGYYVVHMYDGEEAWRYLQANTPDLVITDIEMPNMTGFELVNTIRAEPRLQRVPVFMLSSLSRGIDIEQGFEVGANEYITKPVVPEELISRVQLLFSGLDGNRRESILIVDDSKTVRNMLQQAFTQQGFLVSTAENGQQGLERVEESLPDLVVTDIEMPVMDGYELCNRLRDVSTRSKSIPIIMVSSRASNIVARKDAAQVDAYLTKPFSVEKVVVTAERILANRRLHLERERMRHIFERYVSKGVADRVLSSEGEIQMRSERKDVAVLFADVRNFTSFSEDLEPEEVITALNEYFEQMVEVINEYEGTLDKFIGDCIMATWGSLIPCADAPRQAVKAATEIQRRLLEFNKVRPEYKPRLAVGVGVNSGAAVAGNLGSFRRMEYTVLGTTVNIASRLADLAGGGEIFVSKQAYEACADLIDAEEADQVKIKGLREPVAAFKVLQLRQKTGHDSGEEQ